MDWGSFRRKAHNQCSESFYKKELESDILSGPSKSADDRMKTLDLLRKFEEESVNNLSLDASDSDDDDRADVVQRFAGLDIGIIFDILFYEMGLICVPIDSLSSETIWLMLNPEERKKFTKAMENPSSQLAQELLASEQLEKDIDEPWWQISDSPSPHDRTTSKPTMLQLPSSMMRSTPSHSLLYNTCAIW